MLEGPIYETFGSNAHLKLNKASYHSPKCLTHNDGKKSGAMQNKIYAEQFRIIELGHLEKLNSRAHRKPMLNKAQACCTRERGREKELLA